MGLLRLLVNGQKKTSGHHLHLTLVTAMYRTAKQPVVLLSLFCLLAIGCDTMTSEMNETESPPEQLRATVSTDDQADQIEVTTGPTGGIAGRMRVCLEVETESGWWKGLGLNEPEPTIEGEKSDGRKCTTISPGRIEVAYWKAKGLGIHTHVGTRSIDLRVYGDHEVSFTWQKD